MANTLNDLYLKYINRVSGSLEKDKYYQYMMELMGAGKNTLSQHNQILHKVVDERWLTTIEDSLDSLNKIIEKPRRFIEREEEVVPISLAKKITGDSVLHLSMNTQFLSADDESGEDVHPTKILNVTVKETYDLYENRFIYHLIQHLVSFIDKRTDVIFWSTGDEIKNTMSLEGKVRDADEEIEYKVEMSVKNLQNFMDNDHENMSTFMRIDRVRRMVQGLQQSMFCTIMRGCSIVRSPIQRTNLLIKDPDYRKCYQLWQFLESYDDVGYTIDVQDSDLGFDEEYQSQLFGNMIANYSIFKSILEPDERDLVELGKVKHRQLKPKFIKSVQEEIVDNYDLPDVEIRRVFVQEVTQAQLDAEAKLAELEPKLAQLEKDYAEAKEKAASATERAERAVSNMREAMERADMAEGQLMGLTQSLNEAEQARDVAQINLSKERALRNRADELAAAAEAKAKQDVAAAKQEYLDYKADVKDKLNKAKEEKIASKAKIDELNQRIQDNAAQAKAKMDELKQSTKDTLAEGRAQQKAAMDEFKKQQKAEMEAFRKQQKEEYAKEHAITKAALKEAEQTRTLFAKLEQERNEALATKDVAIDEARKMQRAKSEAERYISTAQEAQKEAERKALYDQSAMLQAQIAQREAEAARQAAEQMRMDAEAAAIESRLAMDNALAQAKEAEQKAAAEQVAREAAEKKAESNKIGKFLVDTLSGRNRKTK